MAVAVYSRQKCRHDTTTTNTPERSPRTLPARMSHQWCRLSLILVIEHAMVHMAIRHCSDGFRNSVQFSRRFCRYHCARCDKRRRCFHKIKKKKERNSRVTFARGYFPRSFAGDFYFSGEEKREGRPMTHLGRKFPLFRSSVSFFLLRITLCISEKLISRLSRIRPPARVREKSIRRRDFFCGFLAPFRYWLSIPDRKYSKLTP